MKNRKRLVSILAGIMAAVMILSLLFSILPSRVWAASSSEIRKQINALQDNRKDIKNQISDLKAQYEATTDEITDIVARKNIIDQQIGLLHTEIININEQLSAYSVLIADQQEELDRAQARFNQLNDDCKTRIRAMEEEGIPVDPSLIIHSDASAHDSGRMIDELLAGDPDFTAIFTFSDYIAWEVIYALNRHGIQVPRDVSVMGFDDIQSHIRFPPPLTTVHFPKRLVSGNSVELLLKRIVRGGDTPVQQVLDAYLVVRETTAAPADRPLRECLNR